MRFMRKAARSPEASATRCSGVVTRTAGPSRDWSRAATSAASAPGARNTSIWWSRPVGPRSDWASAMSITPSRRLASGLTRRKSTSAPMRSVGPPAPRRDPHRVSHLPAAVGRQLRRHRDPARGAERAGHRAALPLHGQAHRGEQVDAEHLQEERRPSLDRGLGARQRDRRGHARLGQHGRVELLGEARAASHHGERRVAAHRAHRALERAQRALVEDADGEHRADAQRDPEHGEQDEPPAGPQLGAQGLPEVARHARSRTPLWRRQDSSASAASSRLWVT